MLQPTPSSLSGALGGPGGPSTGQHQYPSRPSNAVFSPDDSPKFFDQFLAATLRERNVKMSSLGEPQPQPNMVSHSNPQALPPSMGPNMVSSSTNSRQSISSTVPESRPQPYQHQGQHQYTTQTQARSEHAPESLTPIPFPVPRSPPPTLSLAPEESPDPLALVPGAAPVHYKPHPHHGVSPPTPTTPSRKRKLGSVDFPSVKRVHSLGSLSGSSQGQHSRSESGSVATANGTRSEGHSSGAGQFKTFPSRRMIPYVEIPSFHSTPSSAGGRRGSVSASEMTEPQDAQGSDYEYDAEDSTVFTLAGATPSTTAGSDVVPKARKGKGTKLVESEERGMIRITSLPVWI